MYKALLLIISINLSISNYSQDNLEKFNAIFQEGDTAEQKDFLKNWEQEEPDNPELITSYFNYYYKLSKEEVLTIESRPPNELSLEIIDDKDSTHGYISSKYIFENKNFTKAISKIDLGIKKFPNRLDMRYGKIYALGENEEWEQFTIAIKEMILYSFQNNHDWIWTRNKPLEDGKSNVYGGVQSYSSQIYNTLDDDLLIYMQEISIYMLSFDDTNVESLSNLGITYMLDDKYEEALIPLKKAALINPKDYIVFNNIAHAYKQLSDYKNAIEYYEKAIKYGDDYTKEFAAKQIKEIEKLINE